MPPPPAGRAPHITLPSKNVIANQSADRRGNPYTPRTALPVPRRGRRLPTVVPADSRPLSWPPIGALPRNRLASSATGGASPISPTPRLHRTPCPAPVGRGALTPLPICTAFPKNLSLRTGAHAGVAIRPFFFALSSKKSNQKLCKT